MGKLDIRDERGAVWEHRKVKQTHIWACLVTGDEVRVYGYRFTGVKPAMLKVSIGNVYSSCSGDAPASVVTTAAALVQNRTIAARQARQRSRGKAAKG